MKTFLGSLCFALVIFVFGTVHGFSRENDEFSHGVVPRDFITDIINSTVNGVLQNLTNPITLDSANLTLPEGSLLTGSANISNFKLSGLNSLFLPNITLDILNLVLVMTAKIPDIQLSVDYEADLVLAELIPLYGHGSINLVFDGIALFINGTATAGGAIRISDLTLRLSLDKASFNLQGLLDNEELSILISTLLNDNVVKFITNYQTVISNALSGVVKTVINAILSGNVTSADDVYRSVMEDKLVL